MIICLKRKLPATTILFLLVMQLTAACNKQGNGEVDTSPIIGTWGCTYDSEIGPLKHDHRYTFELDGKATRLVYFNDTPLLDRYTWTLEDRALVLHDIKKGWVDSFRIEDINTQELHLIRYFFDLPAQQAFTKINIHK